MNNSPSNTLLKCSYRMRLDANKLSSDLLKKTLKISHAYNPLDYAWEPHKEFIKRYGNLGARVILLGMNPGHGMGNTGIPFGCPEQVKEYLQITNLKVKQPKLLHPKRPVYGLNCPKPEISGRRLWGLLSDLYGTAENALSKLYVMNHCPLWFFNESGQNITPNKLEIDASKELFERCNKNLVDVIEALYAKRVICVGIYAEKMAINAIQKAELKGITVEKIPHPSPANPLANKENGNVWKKIAAEVITAE